MPELLKPTTSNWLKLESGSFWSELVKLTEATLIIICDKMQLED